MTTNTTTKTPRELIEAAVKSPYAIVFKGRDIAAEIELLLAAHDEEIAALKAAQPVQPAYQKWQALYMAVNEMMAPLGYHGNINARDDRVSVVMDALHDLDGGTAITQPAPAAPYQVPDGWQLVPPEPDESMFRAVTHLDYTSQTDVGWIEGYRCMLAAAPKATP